MTSPFGYVVAYITAGRLIRMGTRINKNLGIQSNKGTKSLITFAPVWERSDEGEEPKCVRRRKATAISLQPLSETRENMKKKAAQNEKLQENRLHVFHGSQNYMFSNFFFFCMNRIPGFSANFNEHLTKSREKRRHKSQHIRCWAGGTSPGRDGRLQDKLKREDSLAISISDSRNSWLNTYLTVF
ncbi:uncharacterized protein WM294_016712 [Sarcoramphus papa]